jgi:hypothetical protein
MNGQYHRSTIVLLAILLFTGCATRQHARPGYVSTTLEREVRQILEQHPPIQRENWFPDIPDEMKASIVALQPGSGDALLDIIASAEDELNSQATNVLVRVWDSLLPRQIDRYFRLAMTAYVKGRAQYPQGVKAWVGTGYGMRHDWAGWPKAEDIAMHTVSYKTLDGARYDKPFSYEGHRASSGGVPTGELSLGRHTVRAATKYEVTYKGKTHTGKAKSPRTRFRIVKLTGEHPLAAANDPELDALVRGAFRFIETPDRLAEVNFDYPKDPWEPQVHSMRAGIPDVYALHLPMFNLAEPLPVDLCFDVEIHDQESGKTFEGQPVLLRKGSSGKGYILPDNVMEFVNDRNGFVPVMVVLRPSLGTALSHTDVTKYWVGTITSPVMRAKASSYHVDSACSWLLELRSRFEDLLESGVLEEVARYAAQDLVSLSPHWRASAARGIPRRLSGDAVKPVLPFLIGLLADVDTELPVQPAEYARDALVTIGEPAVVPLQEALNSSDPNIRERAAAALKEIARLAESSRKE